MTRKAPDVPPSLRSAALALVLVLLAGCGDLPGPSDQGTARDRAAAIVDEVRQAVEQAKERAQEETGDVSRETPAQGQQIRTDTQTAFDYERYNETLAQVFASLEEYWAQALPETVHAPTTSGTCSRLARSAAGATVPLQ